MFRNLWLAVVVLTGCTGSMMMPGTGGGSGSTGAGGGTATGGGTAMGGGVGGGEGTIAASAKGNLRFKGPERLTLELSTALELPPEGVCSELGRYPCLGLHAVALGGTDPFGKGLYEGSAQTGVTTSLVTERIVLSACIARVDQDLANPGSAVVFKNVALTGDALSDPTGSAMRSAMVELVHRAWQREPTTAEVDALLGVYGSLSASAVPSPARGALIGACVSTFTAAEAVFY